MLSSQPGWWSETACTIRSPAATWLNQNPSHVGISINSQHLLQLTRLILASCVGLSLSRLQMRALRFGKHSGCNLPPPADASLVIQPPIHTLLALPSLGHERYHPPLLPPRGQGKSRVKSRTGSAIVTFFWGSFVSPRQQVIQSVSTTAAWEQPVWRRGFNNHHTHNRLTCLTAVIY